MATTALITGADKGVSYELARLLANAGNTVILGTKTLELADKTKSRLTDSGVASVQLDTVVLDLTQAVTINAAAATLRGKHPDLSLLINGAGITGDDQPSPLDTLAVDYQAALDVNFFGTQRVIQAFLPLLEANHGRIVTLTATTQASSTTNPAAYRVAQGAVNALIQSYALAFKDQGLPITSMGITPAADPATEKLAQEGAAANAESISKILNDGMLHNGEILDSAGQVLAAITR